MSKGKISRVLLRAAIAVAVPALAVGAYLGVMAAERRSTRLNFEVVEPGRLLRTAQPRPGDLDRIKQQYGLGTIISLRGQEEPEIKEWALKNGAALVSMQMWADVPPTEGQVGLFFDIMRGDTIYVERYADVITQRGGMRKARIFTFPFPVLIHCEGGSDRTGVMVALYRMAFQGWDVKLAKEDMAARFHISPLHPAQFAFLERVAGRLKPEYGSRANRALPGPAAAPSQPPASPAPPASTPAPQPSAPAGAP